MDIKVDIDNNRLLISAKSKGITTDDAGTVYHHRFTKIYIDTADTFVCKDNLGPISLTIPETDVDYDTDLTNYVVSFNDILSDDIPNELLFIKLEECSYIKNGDNYIKRGDATYDNFKVVFSVSTFYNLLLDTINIPEGNCCDFNCGDVNYMLAYNGFTLAGTVEDYRRMIYYWRLLHRNSSNSTSSNCNCNN